jgi:transposase
MVTYDEGEGKRSRTVFGFMALNGKDVVMVSETAKAHDMTAFLELVRRENERAPIIPIMDNAKIHKARLTGYKAEDLDIIRTFLPPYSPDLNPIEFPWKDLKRELSGRLQFDIAVQEARSIALKLFSNRRLSYTSYWTGRFIDDKG